MTQNDAVKLRICAYCQYSSKRNYDIKRHHTAKHREEIIIDCDKIRNGQNVSPTGQNVSPIGQNVSPNGQNVSPNGQNVNPCKNMLNIVKSIFTLGKTDIFTRIHT